MKPVMKTMLLGLGMLVISGNPFFFLRGEAQGTATPLATAFICFMGPALEISR